MALAIFLLFTTSVFLELLLGIFQFKYFFLCIPSMKQDGGLRTAFSFSSMLCFLEQYFIDLSQ